MRGRACPGSFFLFASCHVSLSFIGGENPPPPFIKRNWAELKILSWDGDIQEIPDCKTIVVNLVKSTFTKFDENTLYLHRGFAKSEKYNRNIEVYFATKRFDAVDLLRTTRNEKIGHCICVAMSDDDFRMLFEDVTKCFEDLDVDSKFIQELQQFKQGSTTFCQW